MGRHCHTCGLYDCCEPDCGHPETGTCSAPECNQIYRIAKRGCDLCKKDQNDEQRQPR